MRVARVEEERLAELDAELELGNEPFFLVRVRRVVAVEVQAAFADGYTVWGTREGPLVPVLAVSRVSGLYFAFVAEGKDGALVAKQRPIKVGEIVGNDYAVLEGIKPGDRVIVSGTQFLRDGAPVAPQG